MDKNQIFSLKERKIVQNGHMITYSGIDFNLLEPDINLIKLEDIAHGLAFTCRWNGGCKKYYSVAEHCLNMSKALSGRKMSKEWIEKSAKSRIGLKRSEETKQKMSEKATSNPSRGMLGKIHSKKTKKKISEGNKGKKVSEETKIKISIKAKERLSKSENNPMYGKKHSEETKEKFRLREQRKREKKLLLDSNDE